MRSLLTAFCLLPCLHVAMADDEAGTDFFEKKIRPVLVEHCYKCHSAGLEQPEGHLRLDDAAATRAGGESGPAVVPGVPDDSLLLSAMQYESFEMPPDQRLPDHVIADFRKWISDGAVDPRTESKVSAGPKDVDVEQGRQFWAFQPPQLSPWLGSLKQGEKAADSRVDLLVERRLRDAGLQANAVADRATLLRRLSFDLTGLPPTAEQVDLFVADESPQAVVDAVNRMLQSKAYGQRWARLWLDVARYAEDQAHIVGSNKSLFYPNAWRYREWLIAALNEDMPYDRFIELQLAADLIAPDDQPNQVALGFIGLGPKYYRRNDPEVMAQEWEDRVDVVSRGLLGLTVACARCHDHKYDPIRTEDYYALAGVFASTDMYNKPLPNVETEESTNPKDKKAPAETLHVIREGKVRDLAVMIRGKVDNPGDVVNRGFPEVLCDGPRPQFSEGSGRAELAAAIVSRTNPLTARVIVNRIWQQYFGRGLVATASNFGQLGERPSHPELLDDLAVRFMDSGWSLKWLHREIVLSSAYQRSSALTALATEIDPQNELLWRMPRRRLSVEAWRDAVLAASGRLEADKGGASIRPDDPEQRQRTVYSEVSRFELNPLLARFDFPDPNVHAATRVETNTPLQKLFLLNSPFMLKQAEYLAARAESQANEAEGRVRELFRLTLLRDPDTAELQAAAQLAQTDDLGLRRVAQSLLASNEFWYLD